MSKVVVNICQGDKTEAQLMAFGQAKTKTQNQKTKNQTKLNKTNNSNKP
jgi:hypothetical protein